MHVLNKQKVLVKFKWSNFLNKWKKELISRGIDKDFEKEMDIIKLKEIMENDIARKIPEYKNNKPSFYVLDAYFPSYKKNMCVGLVEKSYYYAARKVRERFGEFHKKTFQKFKSNSEPSKNNLELILIL